MDKILNDLKDPKVWELWYILYYCVMQDFDHQPFEGSLQVSFCVPFRVHVRVKVEGFA